MDALFPNGLTKNHLEHSVLLNNGLVDETIIDDLVPRAVMGPHLLIFYFQYLKANYSKTNWCMADPEIPIVRFEEIHPGALNEMQKHEVRSFLICYQTNHWIFFMVIDTNNESLTLIDSYYTNSDRFNGIIDDFQTFFEYQNIQVIQKKHQAEEPKNCLLFTMVYMFYIFNFGVTNGIQLIKEATVENSNSFKMDDLRAFYRQTIHSFFPPSNSSPIQLNTNVIPKTGQTVNALNNVKKEEVVTKSTNILSNLISRKKSQEKMNLFQQNMLLLLLQELQLF